MRCVEEGSTAQCDEKHMNRSIKLIRQAESRIYEGEVTRKRRQQRKVAAARSLKRAICCLGGNSSRPHTAPKFCQGSANDSCEWSDQHVKVISSRSPTELW